MDAAEVAAELKSITQLVSAAPWTAMSSNKSLSAEAASELRPPPGSAARIRPSFRPTGCSATAAAGCCLARPLALTARRRGPLQREFLV